MGRHRNFYFPKPGTFLAEDLQMLGRRMQILGCGRAL